MRKSKESLKPSKKGLTSVFEGDFDIFSMVKGAGEAETRLNSFDKALLDAGIGDLNLVRISSILPPGSEEFGIDDVHLPPGAFVPVAYASLHSTTPGQYISSAVAVGIPENRSDPGVIMEYSDRGKMEAVEPIVRSMVEDAFAYRSRPLKEIRSAGIEHRVESCGTVFAGVVLWKNP